MRESAKETLALIIINVLPPEYRRRDIGVNPITLSIAGAVVVNLIVALLWAYIALVSIPHAEKVRQEREATKADYTAKAKLVDEKLKKIQDQKNVKAVLDNLLNKKVYWAKTLDGFANMLSALNTQGSKGEFWVSADSLKISEVIQQNTGGRRPRAKAKTPEITSRVFNFDWKVQVVSKDPMKPLANLRTFFSRFEGSDFWFENKFVGDPDGTDTGSSHKLQEDVNLTVSVFDLKWKRQVISTNADEIYAKEKAKQPQQPQQPKGAQ